VAWRATLQRWQRIFRCKLTSPLADHLQGPVMRRTNWLSLLLWAAAALLASAGNWLGYPPADVTIVGGPVVGPAADDASRTCASPRHTTSSTGRLAGRCCGACRIVLVHGIRGRLSRLLDREDRRLHGQAYVYARTRQSTRRARSARPASRRYHRCRYPANASPSLVFNHSNIERSCVDLPSSPKGPRPRCCRLRRHAHGTPTSTRPHGDPTPPRPD